MGKTINLYQAKTQLSALVERAAQGEEIVISKAGKPMAKLAPLARRVKRRSEACGKNRMGVTWVAPDFEEDLPLELLLDEDAERGPGV
jgi:prevent-host-death family protein